MGKLYQKLEENGASDIYPYHMPGHKRQLCGELPSNIMKLDITEIDGFDNLHHPEGILQELQMQAAHLYGAEESFYLVNGSTCGILAAISAAVTKGGHLLMARNSHKSAYHAAYLRSLTLSYLYPPIKQEYDICDAITPQQVEKALDQEKDIAAVFLVSPTYEGRIADIKTIAELVHQRGLPLIVDEAHGAHLGLAEGFAPNSCQCGADLVIHSVHKTLPALTQTALLHVNGQRIDRGLLRRFLHIYQSSSPSYLLMAGIDNALQLVREQGKELFADFRRQYRTMLQTLSGCKNLQFIPLDTKQDIGKLVISSKKAGLSGQAIYDMLLSEYRLQLEMAAGSYCLAMFTLGDSPEGYQRLTEALLEIDRRIDPEKDLRDRNAAVIPEESDIQEQTAEVPFAQAWDLEREQIPLTAANGRIAGDYINLYPPGTPLLVPGERIETRHCRRLQSYLEQGLNVQGVTREAPYYVTVVKK